MCSVKQGFVRTLAGKLGAGRQGMFGPHHFAIARTARDPKDFGELYRIRCPQRLDPDPELSWPQLLLVIESARTSIQIPLPVCRR